PASPCHFLRISVGPFLRNRHASSFGETRLHFLARTLAIAAAFLRRPLSAALTLRTSTTWPSWATLPQLGTLLTLLGGEELRQPRVDVLLQFVQQRPLLLRQPQLIAQHGRQKLPRLRPAAARAAVRIAGLRPARAAWTATRSAARSSARRGACCRFLGEQSRQLFFGHHAVVIGIGPFEQRHQPRIINLIFGEFAIGVLVEGCHH